jgi:ribulose-5-phosphate 4-epimerase/fuculose-1-phosphate aldolase
MSIDLTDYPPIAYDTKRVEPDSADDIRALRKWEAAIGYRLFGALRYGQLGDGHVTARDPELTDHFWVLAYGVPFRTATVHDLTLVGPDGRIVEGPPAAEINHAAHNIHYPIFTANGSVAGAAHTHTPFGTPWSANAEPFRPISQESCSFVFDQGLYGGDDLEVVDTAGGERIAAALGDHKVCILRNHGLLTGGDSPGTAVGWFVMAERVAEVHVKAPGGQAISEEAAKEVARSMSDPSVGWRSFQWLARDLLPDPSVVL